MAPLMLALVLALGGAAQSSAPPPRAESRATLAAWLGAAGVRDLDGRTWTAETLRDRVVLIDAWATWCAPCLVELPTLRALTRGAHDVVVIGISLDTRPRRDLAGWLARHDVDWPQVFDGRGFGGPIAQRTGLSSLPASWLFDRHGQLVARNLRGARLTEVVGRLRTAEVAR